MLEFCSKCEHREKCIERYNGNLKNIEGTQFCLKTQELPGAIYTMAEEILGGKDCAECRYHQGCLEEYEPIKHPTEEFKKWQEKTKGV